MHRTYMKELSTAPAPSQAQVDTKQKKFSWQGLFCRCGKERQEAEKSEKYGFNNKKIREEAPVTAALPGFVIKIGDFLNNHRRKFGFRNNLVVNHGFSFENKDIASGLHLFDMHSQLIARLDRFAELDAVYRHKQHAHRFVAQTFF